MSGGTYGGPRRFGGASVAAAPSRYYIGFWPCQQSDGDADDEQVTDRSGNGAHAVLNSLTSAEAWNTSGYLESLAAQGHSAGIPVEKWTHRFSTDALIVAGYQQCVKDNATAFRIFGNAVGAASTGFSVICTATGALQVNVANTVSASLFSGATSATPFATDSLHSWLLAYEPSNGAFSIYVDKVIVLNANTNISKASLRLADANVVYGPHIGGRPPTQTAALLAVKTKMLHALSFPNSGLPANLSALAARLHDHPRLMLCDFEISL